MAKRKGWKFSEEKILINNYHTATIDELRGLLPGREPDSINAKIKRFKKAGKIKGGKTEETISRAYDQRK
ncbi:hypothetical protein DRQ25_01660 [Candidatus Fermentibacteria bacterium]|nr:MAG: hypothetical protein DRQ25_01660 [Candidatus Fermentibacteria bacterium]